MTKRQSGGRSDHKVFVGAVGWSVMDRTEQIYANNTAMLRGLAQQDPRISHQMSDPETPNLAQCVRNILGQLCAHQDRTSPDFFQVYATWIGHLWQQNMYATADRTLVPAVCVRIEDRTFAAKADVRTLDRTLAARADVRTVNRTSRNIECVRIEG